MELNLKDKSDIIILSDNIFVQKFNKSLVHQVWTSYLSNNRVGTKSNKNRSKVSGSNKKPWKQKGTGRARSGSKKSPIWRSGGVTFGNQIISYKHKINKKMYNLACKNVLSELIKENKLLIFDNFSIEYPKTKILINKLNKFNIKDNVLIITDINDNNLIIASKNLYKVNVECVLNINLIKIINFDKILITLKSIRYLERILI